MNSQKRKIKHVHTHSRNVQRNDNKMSTTTTPTEYMFVKNKTMHIIISFTFLSKRTLIHSRQYTHSLTHVYMPMILIVFKWRISLWLHGNCYYEYNCCCCSLHSACHFHFCVRVRSKCTFVLLVSYLGSVLVIIEQRAYTVHVADVSESRAAGTYSFAFKALFALQL